MKRPPWRLRLAGAWFVAQLLAPPGAEAAPSEDAERLVFLLQYIAADYRGAVAQGAVVDETEYREMVDFAALSREKLAAIRASLPEPVSQRTEQALRRLSALIERRADPSAVAEVVESIIPDLIDGLGLRPLPRELPRPRHAAALYRDACATCHGTGGRGDGPNAAGLDPAPADFTNRARMENTAPYVFYNAITFGIAGTAMASFRDALDDQERWDLAFYLWTFSRRAPASPETASITVALRDLATKTSVELAGEIERQAERAGVRLDAEQAKARVADLRAQPRAVTDSEERLARVRTQVLRAIELVEGRDFDAAADVLTTSYLQDFEPLEPEIDRVDRSVRKRFERGLLDFRGAVRGGDGERAGAVARDLLETAESARTALAGNRRIGPLGTVALLAGLGLVLGGGMAVMALRGRRAGVGKRRAER